MGYSPPGRIAAACRHAAAAAHAALLLRRVCLAVSPSAAAVPSKRQLLLPQHRTAAVARSSAHSSSSCWQSSAAAAGTGSFAAVAAAARLAAPPRRHAYLQHPTLRTLSVLKPASSACALLRCPSSLPHSAAALHQSFSLSASTLSPSPPHTHPSSSNSSSSNSSSSNSSSNFCCTSSRSVSSTSASSKTPGETPARGAKEAAGRQGEQQEEEDPSGASRAPGVTAAARAAAAAAQQETQAAASAGGKTQQEAAAATSAERGEAAAGDRKPHTPATGPSDVHEGSPAAETPAAEDAYATLLEKYRVCLEEVETLRRKAETLQDKALRALADMENARVRHQRELARTKDYAASDFAKAMLEVADSMAYATKALRATLPPHQQQHWAQQQQQQQMGQGSSMSMSSSSSNAHLTTEQLKHIYEGVAMTESLLHRTLDRFGVQQFDPTGEVFNPAVHEALFEIDDPTKEKGRVAQVIQMGYKIKDRVLRAAKVGVARGGSGNSRAP